MHPGVELGQGKSIMYVITSYRGGYTNLVVLIMGIVHIKMIY